MGFLEQPWGFFLTGGLFVGGLVWLVLWIRSANIAVKWYEWLIGAIGLLIGIVAVENFFAAFVEFEGQAAWLYLLVFGLPALILLAVSVQLVFRRHRAGSS
jgi:hypothetical protein